MKKSKLQIQNLTKSRICKRKIKKQIDIFEEIYNCSIDSLSISFINDEEMIKLNKQYLHHQGSTDVITFTYENKKDALDGEIIVCVEEAKRQSKKYRVKLDNELRRLIFHGLLHMIGMDDQTDDDKLLMTDHENNLLENLEERL